MIHQGVLGAIAASVQVAAPAPGGGTTILELLFNGANGSTVFTDTSSYNRTVTGFGAAQISTLQSVSGGSSLKLNGDPDYLQFAWNYPLIGDFSIEVGLYVTGYSPGDAPGTSEIFSIVSDTPAVDLLLEVEQSLGNQVRFSLRDGNAGTVYFDFYSNTGLTLSTWTRVRFEVVGLVATIYFNGLANGTAPVTGNGRIQSLTIGRVGRLFAQGITARGYTGFIDNLTVTDLE
ncbi:hypothetical protein NDI38_04305 [Stenomitos frigidus AS-A4]|uniref:Uncharacterized protein n=1 Tax=Stenomitos frigidus AS-A4 TaxID=2933935 RepID=A0ABV0KEI8_9CYAN